MMSPHKAVGDDGDEGAGEREVPVIPDVNVNGLGRVGEQHDDVHRKAQRDDDGTDDRTHGNGGSGGPADIHDRQRQAEALDHHLDGRRERRAEQRVDDEVQSDEADADREARTQRLAEAGAEAAAEDREDDRHHDRDA